MQNVESPRTDDAGLEPEIAAKSTAPRITPANLTEAIASVHYFTAIDGVMGARGPYTSRERESLGLLTFCVLVLVNGFTVTGESACASPANFDEEIGRKIAYENAKQKVWPLLGFALKDRLWRDSADAMQFHEATAG